MSFHFKIYILQKNIDFAFSFQPLISWQVNLSFYKKASGYRPFLYNITHDFCSFMQNRKRIMLAKIVLDVLLKYILTYLFICSPLSSIILLWTMRFCMKINFNCYPYHAATIWCKSKWLPTMTGRRLLEYISVYIRTCSCGILYIFYLFVLFVVYIIEMFWPIL